MDSFIFACAGSSFSSCGELRLFSSCGAWASHFSGSLVAVSRCVGSEAVGHGPSYPGACGLFLDQRLNSRPQPRQVNSEPLDHQGSA